MDLRVCDPATVEPVLFALRNGTIVTLRPFDSGDSVAMVEFFAAMSPEGRRTRFFSPMPEVPPATIRQLVAVDQVNHLAWGAFVGDRCVGEVRAVRLSDDPAVAEIAFAVADEVRRQGLGRLLVETIGVAARGTGIESFVASVLSDNPASARLLSDLGMRFQFRDGARQANGAVPTWTGAQQAADQIQALQRCAEVARLVPVAVA
jgi:RimJ/RimL family protein N-acetyltransferase